MAGDPSALHARARKLVATLEFQLQQLEEGTPGTEDEARHAVTTTLNALYQEVALLERAVEEDGGQRRELWRKKAAQLSADALALRRAVERHLRTTYAVKKDARERSMLLGGGASDAVTVDAFLTQRASLASSHSLVDDFTSSAGAVLESLRSQRGVMKSAHRRVLDISSSLGFSTGLMRMIERRTTGDRMLVYGGWGAPAASGRPRWHGLAQLPQGVGRSLGRDLVTPRRGLFQQRNPPRDAQPIRVILLGCRATLARAYVTYAVHGGGGRGRCSAVLIQMFDAPHEV